MSTEKTESAFRLSYTVSRTIRATPERVWALLTDAERFPSWNTTVSKLDGPIAPGSKLAIQVPVAPGRTFTPKVVRFEPATEMVWADGMAPMFKGVRTFTLTPTAGGVEFRMTETFTGMFLPMIKGSLPDFRPVFDTYAADLQRAAES
ncbi:MAG: SRPBCC domain-containing protein [Myxococcota bacterium]